MKSKLWMLAFIIIFFSCYRHEKPATLFTLLNPSKTRVDFSNNLTDTEAFNIVEYLNYYNGAGIAAGDINNDGLVDLYFCSNQEDNKLYLNKGNFRFKDITEKAGVQCPGGWKTGVTMADVNGDGLLDIYVCQVGDYKTIQGENHLYINNGDLTFTDKTGEYGLQFKGFSTHSLFFDYDNDGDLDMFLLNHAIHTPGSYGPAAIVRYTRDARTGDRLYKQIERNSKPYFVNVTEMAGIFSSRIGYGLGVVAGDVNNDGFTDLYINNDFHENDYLYINNGNGTFTEKVRLAMGHTSKSSMGNAMADFNNDGLIDIFSLDMLPEDESILKKSASEESMEVHDMKTRFGYFHQYSRNNLQLNRGRELFSEIALYAGVYATDWSWASLFFDADNDGLKDLFITNGIPRRPNDLDYIKFVEDNRDAINSTGPDRIDDLTLISKMPEERIANYAYFNNGDLTFTNKASEWGLDQKGWSNTCAYADLDNDGDLDLVVSNLNEPAFIYRNNSESLTNNHFIRIKLQGPPKNRYGVGARVELHIEGKLQLQENIPVQGAISSMDPVMVFGLGESAIIDSLTVRWPGGSEQILTNVQADQTLTLDIKNAKKSSIFHDNKSTDHQLFMDVTDSVGATFVHREIKTNEFNVLPLLPHTQSATGPKIAKGDVNGDGLEDLYVCGGAGQAGVLFIQQKNGHFFMKNQQLFTFQAAGEETDALFFDADGDHDLDLYVARGHPAHISKPALLSDLLYFNDGKGNFSLRPGDLPEAALISSCMAVADIDNDGDLDLFVGSKPDLLNYGNSSINRLLQNNGDGIFKDITETIGQTFRMAGMVNDAVWCDIDEDNLPDLVLVGEWMPVSIFLNKKDHFEEITEKTGLAKSNGWWNVIIARDLDGDGDTDFVAGNLGQNAKIKAGAEMPATLYARDFDGNGITDPVICYYKNGLSVPFSTLDDLVAQIPSIKNKFPTYASYAEIRSIGDIFTPAQLEGATVCQAWELRSCIIENLGNGTFRLLPLPAEVQLFPVFSILADDLDGDEVTDILLGGNLYRAGMEYGRYDAGYGLFLKGKGDLHFIPQTIDQCGLVIKGQVRDIEKVKTGNGNLLFIGKNNERWQVMLLYPRNLSN